MQNSEKAYGWSKPVGDWGRHIGQERGKTGVYEQRGWARWEIRGGDW